ncbi:MAG: TPM domain-containing protein [Candidatus Halalkalibacterium sp. M3_1C_030]
MSTNGFLTDKQEQSIIKAIAEAENKTSGEIRVHIEHKSNRDPLERAARIFHELGMDETELQNGVLIYIATEDHKASVYAGKGIHNQVEEGFWSDVLNILLDHFKKQEFESGIVEAVKKVGNKLKELYPYQGGDENELTDEISYHKNDED